MDGSEPPPFLCTYPLSAEERAKQFSEDLWVMAELLFLFASFVSTVEILLRVDTARDTFKI